ncbi:uncharacterized protein MJAP1_000156 [Malassezia japonica]|uniref:Uncharacterized protein n=1 Tax=Malassezia japonica TaxID=223818 RepID=A0AAF0J8T9_9BASI|nr:uncharacterized protein MJAP1_000156 [Malassezia japonica]WFD37214.1 hypothetical protein MJAP1_000156 [Malassezia japonica]
MFYQEGDIVQSDRPFGGDLKEGKIEKIESKTGGHVEVFYTINGEKFTSCQLYDKVK